jgi:uncharacterized alpha-E superfamily protein
MWEQINSMYLQIQLQRTTPHHDALPEILRGIRLSCHMFQGITDATMSHDEAWHFLRMGRMMERADKTSRILDVKYFILLRRLPMWAPPMTIFTGRRCSSRSVDSRPTANSAAESLPSALWSFS